MAEQEVRQQSDNDAARRHAGPRPKSAADRWVKMGFLVVILAVVAVLYFHGRGGMELPGRWRGDVAATVELAKREGRPVLIFLHRKRPTHDAREMAKPTDNKSLRQSQVQDALMEHDYLCAHGVVKDRRITLAGQELNFEKMPALVVLDRDGRVVAREEGFVGHDALTQMLVEAAEGPGRR